MKELVKKIWQVFLVLIRRRTKVFVIGFHKTGTTSIEEALKGLGYIMGNQRKAELLTPYIAKKKYNKLFDYCRTAEGFQDTPFNFPDVFKLLDAKFPNSKFVLTVRDDEHLWYNSLVSFHKKVFGKGDIPTAQILRDSNYAYQGYAYESMIAIFGEGELYSEERYKDAYLEHNKKVISYFSSLPDRILVLNLKEKDSYAKLCEFLNKKVISKDFPWMNKTNQF